MSNIYRFPGTPDPPPEAEEPSPPSPPALDAETRHRLEVRLDVTRERVLLWRIAIVFAALAGLLLTRQLLLG